MRITCKEYFSACPFVVTTDENGLITGIEDALLQHHCNVADLLKSEPQEFVVALSPEKLRLGRFIVINEREYMLVVTKIEPEA